MQYIAYGSTLAEVVLLSIATAAAEPRTEEFKVSMSCPADAYVAGLHLKGLNGVEAVKAVRHEQKIIVTYGSGALSGERIRSELASIGLLEGPKVLLMGRAFHP